MLLIVQALLIALCWHVPDARAGVHVGPQLGFAIYHRYAPEETPSLRLSGMLSIKIDTPYRNLTTEITASYENGLDTFATQDSVNDRILRGRLGLIYNPFNFDFPLAGLRLGAQYSAVYGVYNTYTPTAATDVLHPHYWSPYFGLVTAVIPQGGFGVEIEFTTWYDQYFRCLVFQMGFGVDIF